MCTCVPTSSRRPSSTQFSQAGYAAGWLAGTAWPALLTGRVGSGSCSALTALRSAAAAAAPSAPASANTTPGESSRVTVLSRCTSCTALVMPGVLPTCRGTGQGRAAWCSAGGVCAVGLQQRCRPAPVLTAPTAVQQQGPAPLLLPLLQPLLLPLLLPPPLPPSPLPPLLPALLGAHLCHAGALQRVDDTRLAHIGQAHHPHGDRGLDVSIAGIVLQQLQQGVCPQALGAAGAAVGNPDYVNIGCGMGYEATIYLTSRGVRITGTDAWSWDAPFTYTAARVNDTGDTSLIWEGHKAGRDIGYCHLEKLHNLEALPNHGFTVSCFPHKIRGASAGWTRAVAIIDG